MSLSSIGILAALIDDTIVFSECESGKITVNEVQSDLKEEFALIREMFECEAETKGIVFKIICKIMQTVIISDIKKIVQIIVILLSNAFKYTFTGKVKCKCRERNNKLMI